MLIMDNLFFKLLNALYVLGKMLLELPTNGITGKIPLPNRRLVCELRAKRVIERSWQVWAGWV